MGTSAAKRVGAAACLDSATVLLALGGIVIAFSQPPEPLLEMGRVALFYAGAVTILRLFLDYRDARRSGGNRVFRPTLPRIAGAVAVIIVAAALSMSLANSTGSGWLGSGLFLTGAGLALQCLIRLNSANALPSG